MAKAETRVIHAAGEVPSLQGQMGVRRLCFNPERLRLGGETGRSPRTVREAARHPRRQSLAAKGPLCILGQVP